MHTEYDRLPARRLSRNVYLNFWMCSDIIFYNNVTWKITLRMTSNFRSRPFIFSNDAKNIWTVTSHKRMIIIIDISYSLFVDIKIIRSFLLSSAVDKSIKYLFALLYMQTLKEYAIQQWCVNVCLSLSQNVLVKHL